MRAHVVRRPHRLLAIVAALAAGLALVGHQRTVTATSGMTSVMSGLENPRGLAFGPEGALYVVEAGRGGSDSCPIHRNQPMCYGATGALTRLRGGLQERIAVGFPSYISPSGEVTGAHDVSFLGVGGAYVTIGFGGDPAQRGVFGPGGALFGTLVHVAASGQWWPVTDVAAHEGLFNPAGDRVDTNPYGLLVEPGARLVSSQPPARPQDRDNPILTERRRVNNPLRNKLVARADAEGLPLAAGTDLRYTTRGLSMADEAISFQRAGVSPMRALQIMTVGSAACLGIHGRTGAIAPGLEADLVVLDRSPVVDLEALKDIRMVVNDGKIAVRRRD